MLKPSYNSLIQILNKDSAEVNVSSRYHIVIASAKRARQIIANKNNSEDGIGKSDKAVSVAIKEIENGDIRVVPGNMDIRDIADIDPIMQNIPVVLDDNFDIEETSVKIYSGNDEDDTDMLQNTFDDEDWNRDSIDEAEDEIDDDEHYMENDED